MQHWKTLASTLPAKPEAVLVVSGHWEVHHPVVSSHAYTEHRKSLNAVAAAPHTKCALKLRRLEKLHDYHLSRRLANVSQVDVSLNAGKAADNQL